MSQGCKSNLFVSLFEHARLFGVSPAQFQRQRAAAVLVLEVETNFVGEKNSHKMAGSTILILNCKIRTHSMMVCCT